MYSHHRRSLPRNWLCWGKLPRNVTPTPLTTLFDLLICIDIDGLYTKITGAQRIDFFGAEKPDLPSIWKELVDAGFESGHAYGASAQLIDFRGRILTLTIGKALRAVKSCVGSSWCRYGIGDSVSSEFICLFLSRAHTELTSVAFLKYSGHPTRRTLQRYPVSAQVQGWS